MPLAKACAAGHEVAVAAPVSFAEAVAATGLAHHPFADVPPEVMGAVFGKVPSLSFEAANEVVGTEVFGRLDAQAALPGVSETVAGWGPDVVLREPCELARWSPRRPRVSRTPSWPSGCAPCPTTSSRCWPGHSPTLTTVPASLDGPRASTNGAPIHRFRDELGAGGPGRLPDPWGDPAHPLVYVSFGSVAAGLGGFAEIYPAVVGALAGRPVRVLLTTGQGADLGDPAALPDNAHVERWCAVVGHGGFGTTMAALAAGVPQVIVPLFALDRS